MSLADEIGAITAHGCCTTGTWYAQQSVEDQRAFDAFAQLIKGKQRRAVDLYNVCTRNGLEISNKSFRDHLRDHHDAV